VNRTPVLLEIKPLLLYYGIVSYAKAVVVARNLRSLSTLSQTHGLADKSRNGSSLADLELEISARGTFQEFNDSIRDLSKITYYAGSTLNIHVVPTDTADRLIGMRMSLREILARIPWLDNHYADVFSLAAKISASGSLCKRGRPRTTRTPISHCVKSEQPPIAARRHIKPQNIVYLSEKVDINEL
jgi:hypothetical protein